MTKYFGGGVSVGLDQCRLCGVISRVGSMMTLFFGVDRVTSSEPARKCDQKQFRSFFHAMLERGVYLPPSPFEAMFISIAHSTADLKKTISAFSHWGQAAVRG